MIKRILLIVAVTSFTMLTFAQKINHPCLLFTADRINSAKAQVKNDTMMARCWRDIKRTADANTKTNDVAKLDYLSLAYLMSGEKKYSDAAKNILLNAVKAQAWSTTEMLARKPAWNADLNVAHRCFATAVAYDAIYKTLSDEERDTIARGLYRLGAKPAMHDWIMEPTRIHSLNSMGHNWWSSCVCMGGLLAMSLQNEIPEAAEAAETVNELLPEWFDFEGDVLQHKAKTFDEDGGMYESLNYANFGIGEALLYRVAWTNAHPGKQLPPIPQLLKLPDYFVEVCYPRTGQLYDINFGDSHNTITAESSMMLLYALGIRNDNMLWYFNQVKEGQHRDGYFRNRPMGFLYTPDTSHAPAMPTAATAHLWKDFGWATMRNAWNKDATMLAVKSGYTWNHSHADANSFILFHKGVEIIKDAGNCSYPKPEYRKYFFQSDAHNVVLMDGEGQPTTQQYHGAPLRGYLYYLMDGGNTKYVLADGTGPMADKLSRNFRHFLWMDKLILVIDDIKSHKMGKFEWLWHPDGTVKKDGFYLNVTNGKAAISICPLYPRMFAQSDFVHDYPDDIYLEEKQGPTENLNGTEKYYSLHLPATTDMVKAVTVVILKDSPDDKQLPAIERREGKDWIGLRICYKDSITDLYINQLADGRLMHSNSWIEADGWTTDAYMTAVTYKKGTDPADAHDFFICYGSALRRGDTDYFSSLAKLYVIQKTTDGKPSFCIEGQSHVNATFRSATQPASVTVNGKPTAVTYHQYGMNIKYTK